MNKLIITKLNYYFLTIILLSICSSYAQNKLHLIYHNYKVLKNQNNHTFQITNNGKVVYDKLKFVAYAENALQVLDYKNEMFYLDKKLKIIDYPKKAEMYYCGTVDDFFVKIIQQENNYLIERTTKSISGHQFDKKEIIDTIPKSGIKSICFLNKSGTIEYDENFFFPETLIIETTDNRVGLRENGKTKFYDTIDCSNLYSVKVEKNNLFGYYNITKLKYAKLNAYVFNLASFELKNGKKGYIDIEGNEYH